MNTLTAIVPILNEEKLLKESVEGLLLNKEITEVFLVDDCSTDDSLRIMKTIESDYKNVRVFESPNSINKGKGDAITRIKEFISTDYVVIHDADLEYNPIEIVTMLNMTDSRKDIFVIGSRFLNNIRVQHYYRTYYANKFLSWLFSLVHSKKVTDIATCYKLMPSNYFKETKFNESGFAIEIEMVAKFLKLSRNIIETPISYQARTYAEGKKIKTVDGLKYIYTIFKYKVI